MNGTDNNETPLLPPWATDADIDNAVRILENEIHRAFQKLSAGQQEAERKANEINRQVKNWSPILERETEAFLQHEVEGW